MTTTYTPDQYVICGGSDSHWRATTAKTLHGAKIAASRAYGSAAAGTIEVAVVVGAGDQQRFEQVAVKRGYDSWEQN